MRWTLRLGSTLDPERTHSALDSHRFFATPWLTFCFNDVWLRSEHFHASPLWAGTAQRVCLHAYSTLWRSWLAWFCATHLSKKLSSTIFCVAAGHHLGCLAHSLIDSWFIFVCQYQSLLVGCRHYFCIHVYYMDVYENQRKSLAALSLPRYGEHDSSHTAASSRFDHEFGLKLDSRAGHCCSPMETEMGSSGSSMRATFTSDRKVNEQILITVRVWWI